MIEIAEILTEFRQRMEAATGDQYAIEGICLSKKAIMCVEIQLIEKMKYSPSMASGPIEMIAGIKIFKLDSSLEASE